jgi:hypothetical protein
MLHCGQNLTRKKHMKGEDFLPVVTIGSLDRFSEPDYRERCVERLIEIVVEIDQYKGAGRLFIP